MDREKIFKKLTELHWSYIGLMTLLCAIGFLMQFSAAEGHFKPWASSQSLRFLVFFPAMLIMALIDIKYLLKAAYIIYGACLVALILVELAGFEAMGAKRWLMIAGIQIQPSEPMKVAMVLALARYFHRLNPLYIGNIFHLLPPIIIVLLPSALIANQPDLGTALILLSIGVIMFFATGVHIWKFAVVGIAGLCSLPILWHVLHDYQKRRILTFLNPEQDPLGDGYNILQSKIAIGSGGMTGKGLLQGSQSQLSFLPEKQTDFIFTMLTEEFGFLGGMLILLLYSALIAYGILIALRARNHFSAMIAVGLTSLLFMHLFINIAMVMGLLPVVGAPLPFLSYGGTFLLTMMTSVGLILNAHLHDDASLK